MAAPDYYFFTILSMAKKWRRGFLQALPEKAVFRDIRYALMHQHAVKPVLTEKARSPAKM